MLWPASIIFHCTNHITDRKAPVFAGAFCAFIFARQSLWGWVANTPLAASIMAIELFGPAIAPYATVVCVISFLITGRQSIYPSQRISMDSGKTLEEEPALHHKHYGRRASDRKQPIHPRKTLLKNALHGNKSAEH